MGLPESRQENCYISPFKFLDVEHQLILTYTVEDGAQVWISDGDKKLLGRVKAFEEHCDEVLEQIRETWIASPMVRNTTRLDQQTHQERLTSKVIKRGDSIILSANTDKETWSKWEDWLKYARNTQLPHTALTVEPEQAAVLITGSQTSGIPVRRREQEMPTEVATLMRGTSQGKVPMNITTTRKHWERIRMCTRQMKSIRHQTQTTHRSRTIFGDQWRCLVTTQRKRMPPRPQTPGAVTAALGQFARAKSFQPYHSMTSHKLTHSLECGECCKRTPLWWP